MEINQYWKIRRLWISQDWAPIVLIASLVAFVFTLIYVIGVGAAKQTFGFGDFEADYWVAFLAGLGTLLVLQSGRATRAVFLKLPDEWSEQKASVVSWLITIGWNLFALLVLAIGSVRMGDAKMPPALAELAKMFWFGIFIAAGFFGWGLDSSKSQSTAVKVIAVVGGLIFIAVIVVVEFSSIATIIRTIKGFSYNSPGGGQLAFITVFTFVMGRVLAIFWDIKEGEGNG